MIDRSPSIDLLRKYNVQGPRYTSYPPAPSWSSSINNKDYEDNLFQANTNQHPLSLYIHLPFCEKLCYFCGCTTFIVGKNRKYENPFFDAVYKEIDWVGNRLDKSKQVVQFHLGGGTPTFSSPETLKGLMAAVRNKFSFSSDAEIGIEVDPRVTSEDHMDALSEMGFNRLSMGVQDFQPEVQKAINRIQSFEDTLRLVDGGGARGFQSINIDLIYGLPHQTPESFSHTIEQIISLNPDRLAVYSYAHVPWLKKQQEFFQENLPSEKQKFEIFLAALKRFQQAGYEYIGMDHFAKPKDELSLARKNRTLWRNFMGYTTKSGTDLIGIGMSAIGQINGNFFQNERGLTEYQAAWEKGGPSIIRGFISSPEDRLRANIIQRLLCHAEIPKKEIEEKFSINFDKKFRMALEKLSIMEKDGLVKCSPDKIQPTPIGRIFLRNLAMCFDAYLTDNQNKPMFSKTV